MTSRDVPGLGFCLCFVSRARSKLCQLCLQLFITAVRALLEKCWKSSLEKNVQTALDVFFGSKSLPHPLGLLDLQLLAQMVIPPDFDQKKSKSDLRN